MTKAKKRFIAYVFFTIAFVFVVISFIISQQEYSKNNWYVTLYQGDKPKIYIFYPNIPYTINSDDYIRRYAFMTKNPYGALIEQCSYEFGAPFGLERILGGTSNGPACLKIFNITCSDTTYFTMNLQLSGFVFESAHYEIHKGRSEGRSVYYDNSSRKLVLAETFFKNKK